jgi:Zn-dependent protease/CBS domain-containing protein
MSSFRVLTVRGIPIRVHVTFPLVLVLAAFQFGLALPNWLEGAAFGVVVTLLLFVGVVLHELAHSLVAMQFGCEVKEIVLLPLGGVAQMEELPERPYQELLMAVVGPLTSGLIGIGLAAVTLLVVPVSWSWLRDFGRAMAGEGDLRWEYVLPYLAVVNLFLAGFNMIPAFPMDGGRVLRALLAAVIPYGRATAVAVAIGQALAWLIGLYGLLSRNIVTMLVALFVYVGAAQEGRMTRVKVALAGLKVRQVFSRRAQPVSPTASLGQAVDMMLEGFQADFPVCDGERLVGMLTRADVMVGLKEHGPMVQVEAVMQRDFLVVDPEGDLFHIQQQMSKARVGAVPVVQEGRFLGLLTQQDLEEAYRLVSVLPGILEREQ